MMPEQTHSRAAMVVAHPGHELRVYGWLERTRPRVFVLTDGSGRTQRSRVSSTDDVLSAVGASRGSIYARYTDTALYAAILDRDFRLFTDLADELADAFVRDETQTAAGDACEGYNPAHDACRLLLNAAVALASGTSGTAIENLEFTLVGRPDECAEKSRAAARWLRLDDETFARKLLAARNYPELAAEVEAALAGVGSVGLREHPDLAARSGLTSVGTGGDAFRVECLRPASNGARNGGGFDAPPFYEQYGERQVAAGHYSRVLRYREHMLPLAEALRSHVERRIG
jgi:AcrR family transcriptional regulator